MLKRTLTALLVAGLVVMVPVTALAQVAPDLDVPLLDPSPVAYPECDGAVDVFCRPDCSTPTGCVRVCVVYVDLTRVLPAAASIDESDGEVERGIRGVAPSATDCVRH